MRRLGARRQPQAANGNIIGQLLQPVRVIQAMTQVHSNRNADWLATAQTTVFGVRRNSM